MGWAARPAGAATRALAGRRLRRESFHRRGFPVPAALQREKTRQAEYFREERQSDHFFKPAGPHPTADDTSGSQKRKLSDSDATSTRIPRSTRNSTPNYVHRADHLDDDEQQDDYKCDMYKAAFKAKRSKASNDPDTLDWNQAMRSEHRQEFLKAAQDEI